MSEDHSLKQTTKFDIAATFAFFSTQDGECFGGGGNYNIDEFVDDVCWTLRKHLTELLRENPNRTFSLVIDTDDDTDIYYRPSAPTTKKEGN